MTKERKILIDTIKAIQIEKLQIEIKLNEARRKLRELKQTELPKTKKLKRL